jgi:hypothetical protein
MLRDIKPYLKDVTSGHTIVQNDRAKHGFVVSWNAHAPRADEHAIWDTLRSRKPGSLRAMPSQFETSCAI